jgi:hypothetical protein
MRRASETLPPPVPADNFRHLGQVAAPDALCAADHPAFALRGSARQGDLRGELALERGVKGRKIRNPKHETISKFE